MEKKQMNHHEFARLFRTKERLTQAVPSGKVWDCYGTWNCSDISVQGDSKENARIECYNYLLKIGYIITHEENERRNKVLAEYASKARPQRTSP